MKINFLTEAYLLVRDTYAQEGYTWLGNNFIANQANNNL
jgi:hypothetical protein